MINIPRWGKQQEQKAFRWQIGEGTERTSKSIKKRAKPGMGEEGEEKKERSGRMFLYNCTQGIPSTSRSRDKSR